MSALPRLRERAAALPLDRTPLRRAGALAALLVLLLVAGRALGPTRSGPRAADGERQSLRAGAERVSARPEPSLWTAGRVAALVLLAAGGGLALFLHRRAAPAADAAASLEVLETHALGPGQSLRLVACGDEVLLLGVGADGARVLRHWPRGQFEPDAPSAAPAVRFADALASRLADAPETASTPDASLAEADHPPEAEAPDPLAADIERGVAASRESPSPAFTGAGSWTEPVPDLIRGGASAGSRGLLFSEDRQPGAVQSPSWIGGARGGRSDGARSLPDWRTASASGTDRASNGAPYPPDWRSAPASGRDPAGAGASCSPGLPPPGTPPVQGEDWSAPAEPSAPTEWAGPAEPSAPPLVAERPRALRQFAAGHA